MANSYLSVKVHYVFSTKNREKLLTETIRERLYPYFGGIARENGIKLLCVGGTDDHVHLLVSLPPMLSTAEAIKLLKGGSSLWLNQNFASMRFAWQEGYGAFSVSASHLQATVDYINNQEEHHGVRSFRDEYVGFLKKHGLEFDERYVLG